MEKLTPKTSRRSPGELSVALEECQRVVRVTNPAFAVMGPITYYPGFQALGDRFSEWLHGIFQLEILPKLLDAVQLGSDGKGRELLDLDKLVLMGATPMLRNGSGRAGRMLLREGVPVGAKCLQKLEEAVGVGQIVAHFATVFGARCGIFSIGQRSAALAYVYQELRVGAPDWHDGLLQEKLADAGEVIERFFQRRDVARQEKGNHWSEGRHG